MRRKKKNIGAIRIYAWLWALHEYLCDTTYPPHILHIYSSLTYSHECQSIKTRSPFSLTRAHNISLLVVERRERAREEWKTLCAVWPKGGNNKKKRMKKGKKRWNVIFIYVESRSFFQHHQHTQRQTKREGKTSSREAEGKLEKRTHTQSSSLLFFSSFRHQQQQQLQHKQHGEMMMENVVCTKHEQKASERAAREWERASVRFKSISHFPPRIRSMCMDVYVVIFMFFKASSCECWLLAAFSLHHSYFEVFISMCRYAHPQEKKEKGMPCHQPKKK